LSLSHKLEVGERRSLASHYTLTTAWPTIHSVKRSQGTVAVRQGYYMELKHFALQQSSVALTLLSMAECVTYIVASFLGDYLKDRLVYVNIVSSSCLAVICIIWPLVDITYVMILAVAIGNNLFIIIIIIIIIIIFFIIIIERKDLCGVLSKDCKDTLQTLTPLTKRECDAK